MFASGCSKRLSAHACHLGTKGDTPSGYITAVNHRVRYSKAFLDALATNQAEPTPVRLPRSADGGQASLTILLWSSRRQHQIHQRQLQAL